MNEHFKEKVYPILDRKPAFGILYLTLGEVEILKRYISCLEHIVEVQLKGKIKPEGE